MWKLYLLCRKGINGMKAWRHYCHHTAMTLPQYCNHTATILPPHCHNTAIILPPHCHSTAMTATILPPHCHNTATPLPSHCHKTATTLLVFCLSFHETRRKPQITFSGYWNTEGSVRRHCTCYLHQAYRVTSLQGGRDSVRPHVSPSKLRKRF
jgi:hypothetical protein